MTFAYFRIRTGFAKSSRTYKNFGSIDYDLFDCSAHRIQQHVAKADGFKYIYTGEVKGKISAFNGDGRLVWDNGDMWEGYWKNGELEFDRKGRDINHDGTSSILKQKDSESNWQGVAYKAEIRKINRKFDKEMKCGKGELNYNDGTKYQGEWMNMDKHWQGTLYSSN